MYDRFTDRARKVMQLANAEAKRFNHEYIGTEHVLLGLVAEGTGVAANVLKNLNVELWMIRREVEKIVQPGPPLDHGPESAGVFSRILRWLGFFGFDTASIDKLPQTPRTKKVIEHAIEEARTLNHAYVGTEHLLLGLIREDAGVAAHILLNLGLTLERVRNEIRNLLGHEPSRT